MKIPRYLLATLSLAFACGCPPAVVADGIETTARSLQEQFADAVVSLTAVIEITVEVGGRSQTNENQVDIPGTVIRADGLIVTAHSNIEPAVRVPNLPAGAELNVSSEMKDVKVIWPDGTESEATVALNDPDLDLSFIQVEGDQRSPVVLPFNDAIETDAGILDGIVMLARQPKSMERVPRIETGRIGAIVKRPRAFLVPDIGAPGTPAFHENGKLIGLFANKIEEGLQPVRIILPAATVLKVAAQLDESGATEKGESEGDETSPETSSLAEAGEKILDAAQQSVISLVAILTERDREREVDAVGTVLGKDGLIVTANSNFRRGDLKTIKVITDDGSEVNAIVLLENKDLDLMFLQSDMESAKEQGIEFVPAALTNGLVELKAADPVLILARESPAFFRQPQIKFTRVDTVIEEPRRYYRTPEKIGGAPAFNVEGEVIGIYARRVTGDTTRHRMVLPSPNILDAAKEARAVDPASIEKPKAEEKDNEGDVPEQEEDEVI
jgi:S1-C subfamily serine protease